MKTQSSPLPESHHLLCIPVDNEAAYETEARAIRFDRQTEMQLE
jgi:hypothetical protein